MIDPPDAIRDVLDGLDGPRFSLTPEIAYFIAPPILAWWDQTQARGANTERLRKAVAAIAWLASRYEHHLTGSAGSANGTEFTRDLDDPDIIDHERWMTVAQAADRWEISERAVRKRCDRGQVEGAHKQGGQWRLPAAVVRTVQRQPHDEGHAAA